MKITFLLFYDDGIPGEEGFLNASLPDILIILLLIKAP
jgi:hypothetical protein